MINRSRSLKRRFPAFGLALIASLAIGALGAGSASALSLDVASNFNTSNAGTTFQAANSNWNITCNTSTGIGSFTSGATEGTMELRFSKCFLGGAYPCTTSGAVSGEVRWNKLNFKLVYLDAAKTKYGMLLSPATGSSVSEFICLGVAFKQTGSVIGQITSPPLNVSSSSFNLQFAPNQPGEQLYQQVEGAGTKYHLSQQVGGGEAESMALWGSHTGSFPASRKFLP
jgi:hypothetical protein